MPHLQSMDITPAIAIGNWYTTNSRPLPWRKLPPEVHRPWKIMVSEFMLQQTPVNRVRPYWEEWTQRWPTPAALAHDSQADAVRAWGRLGYPRRAQRLYQSALVIAEKYHNTVPAQTEELLQLPGVGTYTAHAIAHFAYHKPVPVVDINIRRVLYRIWYGIDQKNTHKDETTNMERLMLSLPKPSVSAPASLMEFGALVCTAKNPQCDNCPVQQECVWFALGKPDNGASRKPQKYHGTDRYVRGLLMDLLRIHTEPLPADRLEQVWEDPVQRERALRSLLDDNLVTEQTPGQYCLT